MEGEKEIDIEQGRFNAVGSILLFYTLPIVALTGYTWWARESWNIWILGLLLACFGTYFLASLLHSLSVQSQIVISPEPEVTHYQETQPSTDNERVKELEQQVQAYSQMVEDWKAHATTHEESVAQISQENETVQRQLAALSEEYEQYKVEAQALIQDERRVFEEHQHTLVNQKNALEEKQKQILQLESKVKDLNFEIKTLLQLAEKEGKGR